MYKPIITQCVEVRWLYGNGLARNVTPWIEFHFAGRTVSVGKDTG